jgi:hypothetical protein
MSYATQESDCTVGTANPKFDVVIRAYADRVLKFGFKAASSSVRMVL